MGGDSYDLAFARRLFGSPVEQDLDHDEPPADPVRGNVVPSEGRNPGPRHSDHDLMEAVRDLFG